MHCSQCGTELAEGASFCPSCGAAQGTAVADATIPAGPSTLPPSAPPPGPPSGTRPPTTLTFDVKRWSPTDRIVGIATLVLFIGLFLPWFGVSGFGEADGLTAHGYLYVTLILCILVMLYLVVRALMDELPVKLPVGHAQLLSIVTIINLVLVIIAFVFKPTDGTLGGVGWRWGAFVALIAAIVAAAPKLVPAARSFAESKMKKAA